METVNVNGESNDNGGRQMIEKRRSLPRIVTVVLQEIPWVSDFILFN